MTLLKNIFILMCCGLLFSFANWNNKHSIAYNKINLGPGIPDTTSIKEKPISKDELVYIIDSLLDLDSISADNIRYVEYLTQHLKETKQHGSNIPASEFYDVFDEESVFNITPETEFKDSTLLVIESDSLGNYWHPKQGPINSYFGWRDGRMHKGIDIDLERGNPVVSSFDGMVRVARLQGAFGNVVIVRHYNGLETVYAHLSKIKVKPGQVVLAGQLIGLGGNTGRSSGPHLHFEIRFKGQALNPANLVNFETGQLQNDSIIIKKTRYGIVSYPVNAKVYTVSKGDNWFEVAKRFGHTVNELCALNGIQKRYYLKVGQKLRVN